MKFKITMKDPDGVYESVRDAARDSLRTTVTLNDAERATLEDLRADEMQTFIRQWFRYGEYLTVEIDTEAGTIVAERAVP